MSSSSVRSVGRQDLCSVAPNRVTAKKAMEKRLADGLVVMASEGELSKNSLRGQRNSAWPETPEATMSLSMR